MARCSLGTDNFIRRDSDLFSRMIAQGVNRVALTEQLKNTFHRYPNVFQRSGRTHEEINIRTMQKS